jgi:hypothetical protein
MIRPTTPKDTVALLDLAEATGLFSPDDLEMLRQMLMEPLAMGNSSESFWLTDDDNGPVGVAYCEAERMTDKRLFRAFGEAEKTIAALGCAGRYAAIMNRLASSSKLALPYICRFSIFNLLFKPSTGPLLTSVIRLALTDKTRPSRIGTSVF